MTSAVEEQVNPNPEVDSDPEDDPGKMLNVWLGQLQKVRKMVFRVSRDSNSDNLFSCVVHFNSFNII